MAKPFVVVVVEWPELAAAVVKAVDNIETVVHAPALDEALAIVEVVEALVV